MSEPSPIITDGDIAALNQRALLRTIELARRAAIGLMVLAGLLFLAWLWQTLRMQGILGGDDGGFFFAGTDLSLKQRVDALTTLTTPLGYGALVFGVAVALRLGCDAAALRAGASLTGWQVGDPIDLEDDEG